MNERKKNQAMSNPRDTQFAGFATLLFDELPEMDDFGSMPVAEWREAAIAFLAQRAYDLACHVVDFVGERNVKMVRAGLWSTQQCVNQIPDMVAWPKGTDDE